MKSVKKRFDYIFKG